MSQDIIRDELELKILHNVREQLYRDDLTTEDLRDKVINELWILMYDTTQVNIRPMFRSVKTQSIYCVNE